jgi:4-amino-4-deoxy-L-arabinose transferase-like glycosyltransferase
MTKGPVALIPLAVSAVFAFFDLISRGRRFVPRRLTIAAMVFVFFFLVLAFPWHLLMYLRHGQAFVREYFLYHIILRAQTGIEDHGQGFFWYLTVIRHWARFWAAAFLAALPVFLGISAKRLKNEERRQILFLFLWLILTFLIFSSAASKIQWYIVPIYPPLALILGRFFAIFSDWLRRIFPRAGLAVFSFVLLVGLLGLLLDRDQWYLEDYNRDIAEVAKEAARVLDSDDSLLVANLAPGPPIFYSGRKVQTIGFWGLFKQAEDGGRIFVLSPREILRNLRHDGVADGVEVFSTKGGVVLYGRR